VATTVSVTPRVQAAAKKLETSETRILGDFLRLVLVLGQNPVNAASTAHAHANPTTSADKALAFGGTYELVIGAKHRAFYRFSGTVLTLTNIVPVAEKGG
jgi:hypothetical protein